MSNPTGRPPDPDAIRRTGVVLHLLIPPEEKAAAAADAEARGLSLAEHVRDLLDEYRRRRARSNPGRGRRR